MSKLMCTVSKFEHLQLKVCNIFQKIVLFYANEEFLLRKYFYHMMLRVGVIYQHVLNR